MERVCLRRTLLEKRDLNKNVTRQDKDGLKSKDAIKLQVVSQKKFHTDLKVKNAVADVGQRRNRRTVTDTSDIMRPELCEQTKSAGMHARAVDTENWASRAEFEASVTERCHGLKQIWPSVTQHQTTNQTLAFLCSYAEYISMSHSSQTIIKSDIRKEDVAQQRAYSSWLNSPGRKRGFVSTEAGECVPRGREEGRRREWKINVAMMPRV
ncbi:hypothetical protein ALC62_13232 [Cyphomyrmex costatus]|uniref:Uncharacterized protein n=1 Tax=Cyphomyrmex costatus TaxID=456900 RepID=A0A195C6C0_9HYME|nr:hypothetical protein ALC62_13232 [Cyphomyrmex costatus]